MEIERQVDIDDHIPIAVETELDVAVLSVPSVELRKQLRTIAALLEIGNIINLDLDKTVRMIVLTHSDNNSDRLVILELIAHIEVSFFARLVTFLTFLIVPFVAIELSSDGLANAHPSRLNIALKPIKESHCPLHIHPLLRAQSPYSEKSRINVPRTSTDVTRHSYDAGAMKPICVSISIAAVPRAF